MRRIEHLSPSAVSCFLNNQTEFYKKYVAGVWDDPTSPSFLVGSAMHKAIEEFYKGKNMGEATIEGLNYINNVSDYEIDYGKTGSRQKCIDTFEAAIRAYFDECDTELDVVAVEKSIKRPVGTVPMKGKIDLIYRDGNGKLVIRDHKTVHSYSDPEVENYPYIMQGNVYLRLVEDECGEKVTRVEFDEIKRAKNRDGSPQIRRATYTRQQMVDASSLFDKLFTNIFSYVNDERSIFFPNIRDRLGGLDAMRIVAEQENLRKARVIHSTTAAPKFAPRNVTVDTAEGSGTAEEKIISKLAEFGIGGVVDGSIEGNAVTTFKFKPNRGVKMSKIATMEDDLSLALASKGVRIIAPIYGTSFVGIEVPNEKQTFPEMPRSIGTNIPIGKDTYGNDLVDDISKMPHMLIGGQTGSGKSVFLRNIIMSLKGCDVTVADCKMMDFNDLAPRYCNIITEKAQIVGEIARLVNLMESRYKKGVRDGRRQVLVIDEYADLIMQLGKETHEKVMGYSKKTKEPKTTTYVVDTKAEMEKDLARLLQKGRAANISVIIATQRPDATIVAPIIKANCPVKACLRVSTAKNSEIILDEAGGERLLGKGDMLYLGSGMVKPVRLQCYAPN